MGIGVIDQISEELARMKNLCGKINRIANNQLLLENLNRGI